MFDRYNDFLKCFTLVLKAVEDSKINTRSYDLYKLFQEEKRVKDLKFEFESNLLEEIKEFKVKYQNVPVNTLENFKLLIKSINSRELSKLPNFSEFSN